MYHQPLKLIPTNTLHKAIMTLCTAGLEVEWYGTVCHNCTSLAAWKAYCHFFSEKSHTGMLCRKFSEI